MHVLKTHFLFVLFLSVILISCQQYSGDYDLHAELTFTTDESKVEETGQEIAEILTKRLSTFIPERNFSITLEGNRIQLSAKQIYSPEHFLQLITQRGEVNFYSTYDNEEIIDMLLETNEKLREILESERVITKASTQNGDMLNPDAEFEKENPLFAKLQPNIKTHTDRQRSVGLGPVIGIASTQDTATVIEYLNRNEIYNFFPSNTVFMWSMMPIGVDSNFWELYAINHSEPPLSGKYIEDANVAIDFLEKLTVNMRKNKTGAEKWQKMTAKNIGRSIAIVIDKQVISCPTVQTEITGGRTQITGQFEEDSAALLAAIIKNGSFPVNVNLTEKEIVLRE